MVTPHTVMPVTPSVTPHSYATYGTPSLRVTPSPRVTPRVTPASSHSHRHPLSHTPSLTVTPRVIPPRHSSQWRDAGSDESDAGVTRHSSRHSPTSLPSLHRVTPPRHSSRHSRIKSLTPSPTVTHTITHRHSPRHSTASLLASLHDVTS